MSALPPHPSTLTIAKESLEMSEKTGDKNFRLMAIAMMALTGLATVFHAGHVIWRDITAKRGRGPERDHDTPERSYRHTEEPPQHTEEQEAGWVHQARVGDRAGGNRKAWAESVSRENHARQL